ncbi:MAG: GspE/PulE family protein [Candidatus Sumerlaeota bacterium]|nr:GspE/PulE family protein [Candidatus Sumerlaeota bacterium]
MQDLLQTMIDTKQLSAPDAKALELAAERGEVSSAETEVDVLRWLAEEYEIPFTDLVDVKPDAALLSRFPIRREMKKRLGVGADTMDSIEETKGLEVIDERDESDVDLEGAQDASIIRFVNQILADAIAMRATDIHLEPFEDELQIRYRIDGILHAVPVPQQVKRFQSAIVSRVKILSNLDIAEKRLPQDGRIKVRHEGSEIDVRVSVIPMLHGEAVVLRLLHQDTALRGLTELKMGERENRILRAVLGLPHGIMLVTGPTGSGKTTTLYAALSEINDMERKIITIEDPIEYHLKGVNQIQVSEKSGLTFARGLRSILRHDPDVLLIGEIRDGETAQIAVQASLTGHLVFSTLHTNDAPGSLTRLADMGVEPYLIASSLEAALAQRLTRTICPYCKRPDTSAPAQAYHRELSNGNGRTLYCGAGCEACRTTGFLGRRGVFELMAISEEIRELLLASASTGPIRETARRQGMRTLREDGWRLVGEGATTVAEVLRVTKDESLNGVNGEPAIA